MLARLIHGDALERLRDLEPATVQTCVTSPPYWGLRDYNHSDQIGLEPTPNEYVQRLVTVFREVRRVLRDDGTLWLNIGDSYATQGGAGRQGATTQRANRTYTAEGSSKKGVPDGLKPKDLIGVPWLLAFALRADGWYLRSDIIWHKPNPMPESVTDRPTSAHEHVFLLAKRKRYYFDAEAIREPLKPSSVARLEWADGDDPAVARHRAHKAVRFGGDKGQGDHGSGSRRANGNTCEPADRPQYRRALEIARESGLSDAHLDALHSVGMGDGGKKSQTQTDTGENRPEIIALAAEAREVLGSYARKFIGSQIGANARNVWTISTQPFTEAHFAVMPPELARKCILAGSKPGDTVLDPFNGAGTTGLVALQHDRQYIGVELNAEYLEITRRRLEPWMQPRLLEAT